MRSLMLTTALVGLGLVACDNTIFPGPSHSETPTGAYTEDWDGVQDLFDANCITCHGPGGSSPELPGGIEADVLEGSGRWVVPGDPAGSSLWRVLADEMVEGDFAVMPFGSGPLPLDQVEHVKAWIEAGASLEAVVDTGDPIDPDLLDEDGDGFAAKVDCDDTRKETFPGAEELCNDIDDDCNDLVDDAASDAQTFYADTDGDSFGDAATATVACVAPADHVTDATDCDDTSDQARPGGAEICDELDNDCDGTVDGPSSSDASTWHPDGDGDGFGQDLFLVVACADPSSGSTTYATKGGDCNDADAGFNPGIDETSCTDPNDYNCDGSVGAVDGDNDGFFACQECDDGNADVNPDAIEVCNNLDDNCDDDVDNEATDASVWYADSDADSFGSDTDTKSACVKPTGYVSNSDDCDDSDSAVKPSATEICNDVDDNCADGIDDEDPNVDTSTGSLFYADTDDDGYGDPNTTEQSCAASTGYTTDNTDCDDSSDAVNPGVSSDGDSVEDGVDNDCDGRVDQDGPNAPPYYALDIQPIFQAEGCEGCHAFMSNYTGVLGKQAGGKPLVKPNDAAGSFLPEKIDDNPSSGSRMPNGGSRMDQAKIDLIVEWINAGALE